MAYFADAAGKNLLKLVEMESSFCGSFAAADHDDGLPEEFRSVLGGRGGGCGAHDSSDQRSKITVALKRAASELTSIGIRARSSLPLLRCVMGEPIVAIFRRRVAGEADLVQRLVARLSVRKVSEPPAARRGVLL